ncbi:MAG: hypothetical protein JNL54_01905 [Kineosporiaceae bacterium]|nr:hypothetical protein [Kineosporiaceae bacterium]
MRTTVSVSDELLLAAKRLARHRGQTLSELLDDALRRELTHQGSHPARPEVPVFHGRGGLRQVRPGIRSTSLRTAAARRPGLDALP